MNSFLSITNSNKFSLNIPPIIPSELSNLIPITSGLKLWLDADDPFNDRTKPSSDKGLESWKDKSGFNNDCMAMVGTSTTTTASTQSTISWKKIDFNNRPCFSLRGRLDQKFFSGQFVNSSSITTENCYVFIVASNNSTTTGSSGEGAARFIGFSNLSESNDWDNLNGFAYLRQSGTGLRPYRNRTDTTANDPSSYNYNTVWHGGYLGSTVYSSFLNGDSTLLRSGSTTNSPFNINYYKIGSNTNNSDLRGFLTGKISEIIVYDTALTTLQIQQVEGYLAWKWNLQTLLPTNHPYKISPP